jgi:hypothetical protein
MHRLVLVAIPPRHTQNLDFIWRIEDAKDGPIYLANGFSSTVSLATDTWYEDVTGTSMGFNVFNVSVRVNADRLTMTTGIPMFSFLFKVHLDVYEEGVWSASADVKPRVNGEVFRFDERYYNALEACFFELTGRLRTATRRAPRIGANEPAWIWQDRLSPWITGDRLRALGEVASGCAAIENSNPRLACELRAEAAFIGRVPGQALLATRVRRGAVQL